MLALPPSLSCVSAAPPRLGVRTIGRNTGLVTGTSALASSSLLAGSKVGARFVAPACSCASPQCRLTSLDLSDNNLEDESVEAVAVALKSPHCRLTSLHLSYNNLGLHSFSVATVMERYECKLTSLNLSNNLLFGGIKMVRALMSPHCRLTSLDLRGNSLSNDHVDLVGNPMSFGPEFFAAKFPWVKSDLAHKQEKGARS